MVWLVSNQTAHGTHWGPLMAGATLSSIPVVIFFLIIQKNVAMGLTAGRRQGLSRGRPGEAGTVAQRPCPPLVVRRRRRGAARARTEVSEASGQ